jgi:aminomethyltransferase
VIDFQTLQPGQGSLSLLMNDKGCIKDDTVITKNEDHIYMVINAGCKEKDLEHMQSVIDAEFSGKDVTMEYSEEDALVAIQGPKAASIVEALTGQSLAKQMFMESARYNIGKLDTNALFTRCGYTGEDGFEVAIKADKAAQFCELITAAGAQPAGLGARDSLRLEAGLCLYGHEMDEDTSPVDAILQWTISKRRKTEGGFIGYDAYNQRRKDGAPLKRCGFIFDGPGPAAREGAKVFKDDVEVGHVTSGSMGPTVGKNVGMAYVGNDLHKSGSKFEVEVRKRRFPVTVHKMPFTKPGYYRG